MRFKIVNKHNFYLDLYEKNLVSNIYDTVWIANDHERILKSRASKKNDKKIGINVLEFFPSYLKGTLNQELHCSKIFQKLGFAVNLNGVKNAEDYLVHQFKGTQKKAILRSLKRLESSFNITYKTFYGYISLEEYQLLMKALHQMLIKRFEQRNDRNKTLENWDHYLNTFRDAINCKQGSLFAIYSGNKPIEISINFHFDQLLYSSISSFDLDYSKFSLGNIEIYKQLEWCIDNNILIFDMGYGNFDYKRRWSNLIYDFESHIISAPNNKLSIAYGMYLKYKVRLVNYLISKRLTIYYRNTILWLNKLNRIRKPELLCHKVVDGVTDVNLLLMDQICFTEQNDKYTFLRRPIYDFLYTKTENIKDIAVFQFKSNKNAYVIQGKNSLIQINFYSSAIQLYRK